LRSGSNQHSSSSIGECKGIVYATAEGLLKLNSNTAGLPSVAEAGVIVATVAGALLLFDCSVAEVPEK
jgi:hypothetical protein